MNFLYVIHIYQNNSVFHVSCLMNQMCIFLFTKDDAIEGNEKKAAPRDNVVFEAGYFAAAKGRERVLIILEEGAKMPADLGGNIYLSLSDRNDTRPIETAIRNFVDKRLQNRCTFIVIAVFENRKSKFKYG